MPRGIMELVGLGGSVLLAAPVALYGLETLTGGTLLAGVGYLAVAALMILVPYHVTTPDDVASSAAERAVGWVVDSEDD